MLEIQQLNLELSGKKILNELTLKIDSSDQCTAVLGRNGAGKSSLFKSIVGLERRSVGKVLFNQTRIDTLPPFKRIQQGIAFLAQEIWLFKELSCIDNLIATIEFLGLNKREYLDQCHSLLKKFDLQNNKSQQASTLSGGEQRRLELARLMLTQPKLIIMDEPFSGLDPNGCRKLKEIISNLKSLKVRFLISDHQVHHLKDICEKSLLIHSGTVVHHETTDQVLNNQQAIDLYL